MDGVERRALQGSLPVTVKHPRDLVGGAPAKVFADLKKKGGAEAALGREQSVRDGLVRELFQFTGRENTTKKERMVTFSE